jgi:hypothetical protein
VQGGGGVSARSRKCGEVGGLGFGLVRNQYIDRTMPTILKIQGMAHCH